MEPQAGRPDSCGGGKTCVTTGNASLSLCNVDEKGDYPVNVAPVSAEAQKRAEKEAEEKTKADYSSFDIVKAAQYGALERVVELIDEKGNISKKCINLSLILKKSTQKIAYRISMLYVLSFYLM